MRKSTVLVNILTFLAFFDRYQSYQETNSSCTNTSAHRASPTFRNISICYLEYYFFSNFSLVDLPCDLSALESTFNYSVKLKYIVIFASEKALLESTLDLRIGVQFITEEFSFIIGNLKGFSVEAGPAFLFNVIELDIQIQASNLQLYWKGVEVDDSTICAQMVDVNIDLFSNLRYQNVYFNKAIDYKKHVCQYLFKNADITGLEFKEMANTSIYNNTLVFMDLTDPVINVTIKRVVLSKLYRVWIDRRILDQHVFEACATIEISGVVSFIHEDAFKSFRYLKAVSLLLANMREFWHSSDNKWWPNVFYFGETVGNISRELVAYGYQVDTIIFIDVMSVYEYPDADFCLFRSFPPSKLMLSYFFKSSIDTIGDNYRQYTEKTCLLAFLMTTNRLIKNYSDDKEFRFIDFKHDFIESCQLTTRLEQCWNIISFVPQPASDLSYYDVAYWLEWFELIAPIIAFPFVSLVGFLLNLLVILVITSSKKKKEKLFEKKLFTYILSNSAFNSAECFIQIFAVMSKCVNINSVFCAATQSSYLVQNLHIYVIGYGGEVPKTCSILNGIVFSLERYIETSQTKNKMLKSLAAARVRRVLYVIVLVSLITSVEKLFDSRAFRNSSFSTELPFSFYINSDSAFSFSHFAYFFHFIFNDLIRITVNFFIDICLVRLIRSNLSQKQAIGDKLMTTSELSEIPQKSLKTKTKNDKEKEEAEKKTNSMIIYSLCLYILCRIPELTGYIFVYFYKITLYEGGQGCLSLKFCYLITEVTEFFYMLSYLMNVVIYYKFNKNFRLGFIHFFKKNQQPSE